MRAAERALFPLQHARHAVGAGARTVHVRAREPLSSSSRAGPAGLAQLPSRGLLGRGGVLRPTSSFPKPAPHVCDYDSSPPAGQVVATDGTNLLIRALMGKQQRARQDRAEAKQAAGAGGGAAQAAAEASGKSTGPFPLVLYSRCSGTLLGRSLPEFFSRWHNAPCCPGRLTTPRRGRRSGLQPPRARPSRGQARAAQQRATAGQSSTECQPKGYGACFATVA